MRPSWLDLRPLFPAYWSFLIWKFQLTYVPVLHTPSRIGCNCIWYFFPVTGLSSGSCSPSWDVPSKTLPSDAYLFSRLLRLTLSLLPSVVGGAIFYSFEWTQTPMLGAGYVASLGALSVSHTLKMKSHLGQ